MDGGFVSASPLAISIKRALAWQYTHSIGCLYNLYVSFYQHWGWFLELTKPNTYRVEFPETVQIMHAIRSFNHSFVSTRLTQSIVS
ncbi:AAEL016962-PA [Aedes aegypti]|uniref:AAEL016962-PA n=1 Tax=Aedes aegypti TaxID=7159 RepID=J9HS17_AEDAE|nr:AAEL016962-PA [Aedes aegypti]